MLKIQVLHIKKKDLIQWFLITNNIKPIRLRYSEIEIDQKNIKRVCYWKDLRQFLGMLLTVDHQKIEKYQDELKTFRYPVDVIHPPSKVKLNIEWTESKIEKPRNEVINSYYPIYIIDPPLKPKFSYEWVESKIEYELDVINPIGREISKYFKEGLS